MITRGNSRPFVLCRVIKVTLSDSPSSSSAASRVRSRFMWSRKSVSPCFVHGYRTALFTSSSRLATFWLPVTSSCSLWNSSRPLSVTTACTNSESLRSRFCFSSFSWLMACSARVCASEETGTSGSMESNFLTRATKPSVPSFAFFESFTSAIASTRDRPWPASTMVSWVLFPIPRTGLFTMRRKEISSRGLSTKESHAMLSFTSSRS